MILTATLNAELDQLDGEIAALNRRRFRCLGRCDHITARRIYGEMVELKRRRDELITGRPAGDPELN